MGTIFDLSITNGSQLQWKKEFIGYICNGNIGNNFYYRYFLRGIWHFKSNFILKFKQVSSDGKHTLSYASFVAGYLEINEENKARNYFERIATHFNGPFLVIN